MADQPNNFPTTFFFPDNVIGDCFSCNFPIFKKPLTPGDTGVRCRHPFDSTPDLKMFHRKCLPVLIAHNYITYEEGLYRTYKRAKMTL